MEVSALLFDITKQLKEVQGISAIVLGGSRGKEVHSLNSDIDIEIYYDSAEHLDLSSLQRLAAEMDDSYREDIVTNIQNGALG